MAGKASTLLLFGATGDLSRRIVGAEPVERRDEHDAEAGASVLLAPMEAEQA